MSFSESYNTELQRLKPLISTASQADKEFHQAWKEDCAKLGFHQYKQSDLYGRTLVQYHESCRAIDWIVSTAIRHAKQGDLTQVPMLFAYIAFPERYFRSGYLRAEIWRFLKKLSLDNEQCRILRGIVLDQIEAAGPEFTEIARAARMLNSADFREKITHIGLQSKKDYILRRTKQLLSLLETETTG